MVPMQSPAHASQSVRLGQNLLTQLADSSWIGCSVAIIVWLYPPASPSATLHITVAVLAGVLFCLAGAANQLYQIQWRWRPLLDEAKTVWICWAWVVAPLLMLGFAAKVLTQFSRVATISWILLAPTLIVLQRTLVRVTTRPRARRAALAGISEFSESFCNLIRCTPALGLTVVGVFDDREVAREGDRSAGISRTDNFAQLVAAARAGHIDVVYVALPLRAERRVQALVRALQDSTASVYMVFDFVSLAGGGYRQVSYVGSMPVVPLLAGKQPSVRTRALTFVHAMRHGFPRKPAARKRAAPTRLEPKHASVEVQRPLSGAPHDRPSAI
jgi:hypothetical protein